MRLPRAQEEGGVDADAASPVAAAATAGEAAGAARLAVAAAARELRSDMID